MIIRTPTTHITGWEVVIKPGVMELNKWPSKTLYCSYVGSSSEILGRGRLASGKSLNAYAADVRDGWMPHLRNNSFV